VSRDSSQREVPAIAMAAAVSSSAMIRYAKVRFIVPCPVGSGERGTHEMIVGRGHRCDPWEAAGGFTTITTMWRVCHMSLSSRPIVARATANSMGLYASGACGVFAVKH
jgi:hypothetical protein